MDVECWPPVVRNEAAFLSLIAAARPRLTAYMRTATPIPEDVEDLVAEAVVRAWLARPAIESGQAPMATLIELARAACRDYAHRHPRARLAQRSDLSWVVAGDRGDSEAITPREAADRRA
jgi:DNA-directed RNA polymerase specialized sigma24 family protein